MAGLAEDLVVVRVRALAADWAVDVAVVEAEVPVVEMAEAMGVDQGVAPEED